MADKQPNRRETDETGQGDDLDARMAALKSRLDETQPKPRTAPRTDTAQSGIAQAWRLSSEFIAGVVVGTGIGWVIDYLFGTAPWGFITFMLLGFGAAVMNVMRAVGRMTPSNLNIDAADRTERNGDAKE